MTKRLKNLLAGAATIGSIMPTQERPPIKTLYAPAASATEALRGDWVRVGNDIRRAMEKVSGGTQTTP